MKKDSLYEGIKEPLFAAANSGKGFVSFYGDIFGRETIERKYIIKGGPGTGKSSFMKKVAAFAEGKGKAVEYYRCSSDPDSLDGIVVDQRIALIDGTSPHSEDVEIAGARDEIINLGEFWNDERLFSKYEEIKKTSDQKSKAYRMAYRYLDACLDIENINYSLLIPCILKSKMKKCAERIVERIPRGKNGRILAGLEGSLGMKGQVRFSSYIKEAKRLFAISDYYNSASLFLAEIADAGLKNNNLMRVSYDHLSASRPDSVYFVESGVCFVIAEKNESSLLTEAVEISMKRFVDPVLLKEVKGEIRSNFKIANALLGAASDSMRSAGEYHFLLEEIYKQCMDFESQNRFCQGFCEKIEKYL